MVTPAIEFIEDKVQKSFRVFEFGSGYSTLWWSSRVREVISIENDVEWFKLVNHLIPTNVNLTLADDSSEYIASILEFPDRYFDVIVVDGISRNECLQKSMSKLKESGFLIFDNTDRNEYEASVESLQNCGYKRIDFWGLIPGYLYKNCTSVFFRDTQYLLESLSLPSRKQSCLGPSCFQSLLEIELQTPDLASRSIDNLSQPTSGLRTQESNQKPCNYKLSTAIAFCIFNRPDRTQQVFQAIREAQPSQLLVIADGPRSGHPNDLEDCQITRSIIDQVDWDCEVLTNFSDINLGCRQRISSGLDWVFEQVEEAIILEDDCLPDPSFFPYCQELLERYRDTPEVMMISGNNFQFGHNPVEHSYYFSHYGHVWGWATWRRAWQKYDNSLAQWPQLRNTNWLQKRLSNA